MVRTLLHSDVSNKLTWKMAGCMIMENCMNQMKSKILSNIEVNLVLQND